MLFRARRTTGASKDTPAALWYAGLLPGFLYTLITLPAPSRRRYGGYIVHFGIVLAFLGFTGRSWTVDRETSMSPGDSYAIESYRIEYLGPRMEVDNNKRMIFADLRVTQNGKPRGTMNPAKYIYKKSPESPTTEVSMMHSVLEDLYIIIGTINPTSKVATLQIHINPLVSFIWFGLHGAHLRQHGLHVAAALAARVSRLVLLGRGSRGRRDERDARHRHRAVAEARGCPGADGMDADALEGSVEIRNDTERHIFSSLRCMCGTCARDLLSTCTCNAPHGAEEARADIRAQLARGESAEQIIAAYQKRWGAESLAVPPNTGAFRAIYAVPIVAIFGGCGRPRAHHQALARPPGGADVRHAQGLRRAMRTTTGSTPS